MLVCPLGKGELDLTVGLIRCRTDTCGSRRRADCVDILPLGAGARGSRALERTADIGGPVVPGPPADARRRSRMKDGPYATLLRTLGGRVLDVGGATGSSDTTCVTGWIVSYSRPSSLGSTLGGPTSWIAARAWRRRPVSRDWRVHALRRCLVRRGARLLAPQSRREPARGDRGGSARTAAGRTAPARPRGYVTPMADLRADLPRSRPLRQASLVCHTLRATFLSRPWPLQPDDVRLSEGELVHGLPACFNPAPLVEQLP